MLMMQLRQGSTKDLKRPLLHTFSSSVDTASGSKISAMTDVADLRNMGRQSHVQNRIPINQTGTTGFQQPEIISVLVVVINSNMNVDNEISH